MKKDLNKEVFEFHNKVRQNPQLLIPILEERLKYFKGNHLHLPGALKILTTKEGPDVVKETIAFLKNQKPLPALGYEVGLEKSAMDHAQDIGSKGMTGHEGSDHSSTRNRIERYGRWKPGSIGENISFGKNSGEDVIIQLVVDDGVASRGHRKNIFHTDYKLVGIACAEHKTYHLCVVLDYSFQYKEGQADPAEQEQKKKEKEAKQKEKGEKVEKSKDKEKLPEGCKSLSRKVKTVVKGGKKHVTVTKVFKMFDGSEQTKVEEYDEDA